MKMGAKKVLHL